MNNTFCEKCGGYTELARKIKSFTKYYKKVQNKQLKTFRDTAFLMNHNPSLKHYNCECI